MIPKIKFRHSKIYDDQYRNSKHIQEILKKEKKDYPSPKEIINYIGEVKKIWKKQSKKILKEIQKVSGLKWNENQIICYVIGRGKSFSDPLTVRAWLDDKEKFINTLTHELIHNLQVQNRKSYLKWDEYAKNKYKKEPEVTKDHILLLSIHWKILEKIFGKDELEREIKSYDKMPDYKKAWKIVRKEGAEKIIEKFKEVINK